MALPHRHKTNQKNAKTPETDGSMSLTTVCYTLTAFIKLGFNEFFLFYRHSIFINLFSRECLWRRIPWLICISVCVSFLWNFMFILCNNYHLKVIIIITIYCSKLLVHICNFNNNTEKKMYQSNIIHKLPLRCQGSSRFH